MGIRVPGRSDLGELLFLINGKTSICQHGLCVMVYDWSRLGQIESEAMHNSFCVSLF